MTTEAALQRLQTLLYGINYCVSFHSYTLHRVTGATAEDYIFQALPDSVIGGTQSISSQEALAIVEQSLRFTGGRGSGPHPVALSSREFESLLQCVLSDLEQKMAVATAITSFWLKSGHPAYPVFWEFGLVIVGRQSANIFMGSSSD